VKYDNEFISTIFLPGGIKKYVANSCERYDNIKEASDVIFFGFPSDLSRFNMFYPKYILQFDLLHPIFKKGIIAQKNDINRTLIIDGAVYGGNSGSPVITLSKTFSGKQGYYLIGICTQFIPTVITSCGESDKDMLTNISIQNSGYSVVEPIDTLMDLLEGIDKP